MLEVGEGGWVGGVVICQINETVIGGATHTIKSYNGFTGLLDKEKKSLCQHS